MNSMASQITSLTIVSSTIYSGADQRKHQSSASLAFARGIHRWPVNSPHKWPVTRKKFLFDDVIMLHLTYVREECQVWIKWATGPSGRPRDKPVGWGEPVTLETWLRLAMGYLHVVGRLTNGPQSCSRKSTISELQVRLMIARKQFKCLLRL